jgi:acyl-CoA thioester hydrolase
MNKYSKRVELRWADLDPNFHVRHSVYYDYGASCRIDYMEKHGLTAHFMQIHHFGPILFREECIFKREIRLGDELIMDVTMLKATRDYSRWTMQHQLIKNNDTLAAIITIDGAWIDLLKRKLTIPPPEAQETFDRMVRSDLFQWTEK